MSTSEIERLQEEIVLARRRVRLAKLSPLRRMSYWWYSAIGRFAVILPWLVCICAIWFFTSTGQGSMALEYPVDRPLLGVILVGVLSGMCWVYTGALALLQRLNAARSMDQPLTVAVVAANKSKASGTRFWVPPDAVDMRLATKGLTVVFFCTWFIIGDPVRTVASLSVNPLLVFVVFALSTVAGAAVSRIVLVPADEVFGLALFGLAPPLLALGLLVMLIGNSPEEIASVGAHALVAAGMLTMALLILGVQFVLHAAHMPRVGWLLLALLVALHFLQSPLPERPNPLLVEVPQVDHGDSMCARRVALELLR